MKLELQRFLSSRVHFEGIDCMFIRFFSQSGNRQLSLGGDNTLDTGEVRAGSLAMTLEQYSTRVYVRCRLFIAHTFTRTRIWGRTCAGGDVIRTGNQNEWQSQNARVACPSGVLHPAVPVAVVGPEW